MISWRWLWIGLFLVFSAGRVCGGEETITLPNGENLVITVPDRLKFRVVTESNTVFAEVTDPAKTMILQLQFMPHLGQQFDSVAKQRAMIGEFSRADIEQSVEQKLIFKDLTLDAAAGQYVVITDGNLLGHEPPIGQYLKLTRGIKVGTDFAVVFSILSQDESSRAYHAAMKIARDGVEKK